MLTRRWFVVPLGLICLACRSEGNQPDDRTPWLEATEREFPAKLSEVGLWDLAEVPDLWSADTHPRALAFAPHFPLWTNGALKQRQLVLPEGESIDAANPTDWQVPAGSIAFKTLYFADDSGAPVPAETRIIRTAESGARRYAVYVWNQGASDAARTESGATLDVRDFSGATLEHQVPSETECSACHDSSPQALLGLNGYQQQLGDAEALPATAFVTPPAAPGKTLREDDMESDVLGYFVANCSHCHNGWHGPNSEFSLLPDAAFKNLIDVESKGSASTDGVRVIPGDPENSLVIQAMDSVQGIRRAKPMPPLGVQVEDSAGMNLIEDWIEQLHHEE